MQLLDSTTLAHKAGGNGNGVHRPLLAQVPELVVERKEELPHKLSISHKKTRDGGATPNRPLGGLNFLATTKSQLRGLLHADTGDHSLVALEAGVLAAHHFASQMYPSNATR